MIGFAGLKGRQGVLYCDVMVSKLRGRCGWLFEAFGMVVLRGLEWTSSSLSGVEYSPTDPS